MKIRIACVAGVLLLAACGEPDVVVVEPIEEEGVNERVISGDGIEAHEQVDAIITPERGEEEVPPAAVAGASER